MYIDSPDAGHGKAFGVPNSTRASIWKDTSADALYGSYLDHRGDNNSSSSNNVQMRPTASRMTLGANHPDITVGLLEDDVDDNYSATKKYTGRKRVWPGACLLLLITAASLGAIAYFGVKEYNAAQTQQQLSAEITGDGTPKVVSALKSESVFIIIIFLSVQL